MMNSLNKDPLSFDDLLKKMGRNSDWNDKLLVTEIRKNFESITSASLAKAVVVYDLKYGVLRLRVNNTVWRTEIQLRKIQIIEKINNHFDNEIVKSIVIV